MGTNELRALIGELQSTLATLQNVVKTNSARITELETAVNILCETAKPKRTTPRKTEDEA